MKYMIYTMVGTQEVVARVSHSAPTLPSTLDELQWTLGTGPSFGRSLTIAL